MNKLYNIDISLAGNPPAFKPPNPWPVCVPYLDCSEPPLDPQVMKYDWTPGVNDPERLSSSLILQLNKLEFCHLYFMRLVSYFRGRPKQI